HHIDGGLRGVQLQAQLLLDRRIEIRHVRIVWRCRRRRRVWIPHVGKLEFIRRPVEREIVSTRQSSLVHYGLVQSSPLHYLCKERHRHISRNESSEPRKTRAGCRLWIHGTRRQPGTRLRNGEHVHRQFFLVFVKLELEPVGKQLLNHDLHL